MLKRDVLKEIILKKQEKIILAKGQLPLEVLKEKITSLSPVRPFIKGIVRQSEISLIAEIKKASPSAGVIIDKFEPVYLGKLYEESGAAAISVLTDKAFFLGKIEYIKEVKDSTTIPILRKDFIIDESQIYESRVAGADAILLIVRILTDEQLAGFLSLAQSLKMACLVEAHDEAELERALKTGAEIIGINNRDLETFKIDFNTTIGLMDKYPELKKKIVISESGIESAEQVKALREKGVSGILVGESLLRSADITAKIKELMG